MRLFEIFSRKDEKDDYSVPPPELITFVGGTNSESHKQIGEEFLNYFITRADLKPNANVLDIGCGCGRMAVPLAKYLTNGSYKGFDVSKEAVDWCNKNIASRRKNFEFKFVNLYNGGSNPNGSLKASEFSFPYLDNCFDFIFITSVFTHMMPEDMEHYVSEICRVLKKNGKVMATHFLMNQESSDCIEKGLGAFSGICKIGTYYTIINQIHEGFMAFDEDYIKDMYSRYGWIIISLNYGCWCGRTRCLSFQDLLVLQKSTQTP